MRMSFTIDSTKKESQKGKMVKEEGLEKWTALEERIRTVEGNHLCDVVKAVNMCLVPKVVIPKKFRVLEFIKYTGTQCPYNSSQGILQQNSWGGWWWEIVDSFLSRQLKWHCPHLVYTIG
jgi:hypothetical protein